MYYKFEEIRNIEILCLDIIDWSCQHNNILLLKWLFPIYQKKLEKNVNANKYFLFACEKNLLDIEKKIISLLETKIRPAVARDGGDIKFENYKDGVVQVKLEGSCSGCPSSKMTLKQGVQNLLCHYIPEIKEVVAN